MLENHALFGVPLPLIGFGCFLIALLFLYLWPKSKAKPYKRLSWPGYILHYFHPLAWVLLGMAAFLEGRSPVFSAILAALGGLVYLVFLYVLVKA
jgi:hypothetical protein